MTLGVDDAQSGKRLDRNFCPQCGARVFTSNREAFPGMIFVMLSSLDNREGIDPVLEMFTKTTTFLRHRAFKGAVGSTQAVWKDQRETEPSVTES